MAEAFPSEPDGSSRVTSFLLLGTKWQFDTYGLSTVNKSLVNNLRLVDPEAKAVKITCAVVEEEGKIKETDCEDAKEYRVELKGSKRPRGKNKYSKPVIKWLDENSATYYYHLVNDKNYDFII